MKILKPPSSKEEAFDLMVNSNPDFLAVNIDASLIFKYSEDLKWIGVDVKESRVVDYTDYGRIAFIRYPGNTEIFHYYHIMTWPVILVSFIVAIVFTLFIVSKNFNIKQFVTILLDILALTISPNLPRSLKSCNHSSRLILGPILLFLLVASIKFCNLVLEDKLRKIKSKLIDSWDDLALWKDVQIVSLEYEFITEFVQQDNDMARNFKKRFNEIDINVHLDKEFLTQMAMNISNGKAVFIKNRSTLIFMLMIMAKYIKDLDPNFLDHVHISQHGSTNLPYFIPVFHSSNHPYYRDLNNVYVDLFLSRLFIMIK